MTEAKSPEFRPFASSEARERYLANYAVKEKSWPVEFEAKTVESDAGETFVRISGPVGGAPPLVLLPGGQSSSLVWQRLIAPLSNRCRTYALDAIYDAGRSVPRRPMQKVSDLTAWLDDVLDALHLSESINMMGLSYGAYVAAEYALHAPQRLSKVVWLSPAMIVAPISHEFISRLQPGNEPARTRLTAFVRWLMPGVTALGEQEVEKHVGELMLIRDSYVPMLPVARSNQVLSDDELRNIDLPVLYLVGEHDGVCDDPRQAVARVNTVAPKIQTLLIPGAGHDAIVSHSQVVAQAVLQFLTG
jgi:pimeloyl-ACP methyl ester carboxylesterase